MTSNQQFILALIAGLAGILIPAFKVILNKIAEIKTEVATRYMEIDGKIYEIGKNIDGKMELLLTERGLRERAEGKEAGVAQEKADQALRAGRPSTAPPASSDSSVATITNPLVTQEKMKEILADQPPPTVIAVNTEGEALLSEKTAVQLLGTPPSEPDELVRKRWEEDS